MLFFVEGFVRVRFLRDLLRACSVTGPGASKVAINAQKAALCVPFGAKIDQF